MESNTVKTDWLTSKLISLNAEVSSETKSYRFIILDGFHCMFLTMKYQNKEHFKEFFEKVKNNEMLVDEFKNFDPFFVLFYDLDDKFVVVLKDRYKVLTSNELVNFFTYFYQPLTENRGVYKGINKTVNDTFQSWTRKNLNKNAIINDIDAFHYRDGKYIFLELKRPKERIDSWKPYLNDIPNYKALEKITNYYKGELRVVSYNLDDDNKYALHADMKFNSTYIFGNRYVMYDTTGIEFNNLTDVLKSRTDFIPYQSMR